MNNMKNLDFNSVKQFFNQQTQPYYFVSATNFNLIDMHNWVNHWHDINFIDCYDQNAPHVFVPSEQPHALFEHIEDINEYLLDHPETIQKIKDENTKKQGNALFLFFNEALENTCQRLNLKINLPKNELVKFIDNKISTTEIGNQAQVFSVPNTLAKVDSFATLKALAEKHQLGEHWVIQSAYGDSGKTTYFIHNENDYNQVANKIEDEDKVKIMKQIRCVGTAIEACATRTGTYVGPLLGELIGMPSLTPYQGGWCGNELYPENFSPEMRAEIHQKTEQLGDELYRRGYQGSFEVDYLIDLDDHSVYLGEINPRITGITAMTNMSPFCQKTIPLFLLHLMEYAEQPIPFSATDYNALSLSQGAEGATSQIILKHTKADLEVIEHAPVSGVYELTASGELSLIKAGANPTEKLNNPNWGYVLRIQKETEYAYKGGDLAILFLNIQITQDKGMALNAPANTWINALNQAFKRRPLTAEEKELVGLYTRPTKGE